MRLPHACICSVYLSLSSVESRCGSVGMMRCCYAGGPGFESRRSLHARVLLRRRRSVGSVWCRCRAQRAAPFCCSLTVGCRTPRRRQHAASVAAVACVGVVVAAQEQSTEGVCVQSTDVGAQCAGAGQVVARRAVRQTRAAHPPPSSPLASSALHHSSPPSLLCRAKPFAPRRARSTDGFM